ncbi:MAG: CpaF family protein [Acidimicrobiia bacterium]|nr:CpaF family protein [Acidimicrobiia bacterium]
MNAHDSEVTNFALVRQVRERVAARLAERRRDDDLAGRAPLAQEARQAMAAALIDEEISVLAKGRIEAGQPRLDLTTEEVLAQAVYDALFAAAGLQRLLEDESVTDIHANGCDIVFVRRADGSKEREAPIAASDDEMIELIRTMGARMGLGERRFDSGSPQLDLRLPDGSRLSAVMDVSARPTLSIRRHRYMSVTLEDLMGLGAIDEALASFLAAAVYCRANIVVGGGTGVGKTTLLRALADVIPASERLVTIENTLELGLDQLPESHPDVVALEAREANTEGQGAISMAELVRRGLRMDPDRVIVGEVLGDEVLSLLNAMSQGNDGSLCTIHANSSEGVFRRIASYAVQSPERLDVVATNLLIAGAVNFVVFIDSRYEVRRDGRTRRRFVSSVREVVDADDKLVISNEVFRPGSDGRAVPGAPIRCMDALVGAGFDDGYLDRADGWWAA